MEIRIPYGTSSRTVDLPDNLNVDIIKPAHIRAADDPIGAVQSALDNLLGDVGWSQFSKVKSVAIAVSDKTRPVPHHHLLPPLLERLASLGISEDRITFFVAGGTHLPMAADEYPLILPDSILRRYRVVSHDSRNNQHLVHIGETSSGTPIWSNQGYYHSDLKIVVGNIEPHQFAGFTGGVKGAAIGLTGFLTINHNHAMMTHPGSKLGEYKTNPVRQDMEEIGRQIGTHIVLDAILNQDKQIVCALAGDPISVMNAGVPISRQVCQIGVPFTFKLMITSPGGHPKDINLYQAQKGFAHSVKITQPGGTVILAAACPEGTGSKPYEDWMLGKKSYSEVIDQFQMEAFRIGPHKAFQIARDASIVQLLLISEFEHTHAQQLLLNPVKDIQSAINFAIEDLAPGDHVGVIPNANSTIPYLSSQNNKKNGQ